MIDVQASLSLRQGMNPVLHCEDHRGESDLNDSIRNMSELTHISLHHSCCDSEEGEEEIRNLA